MKCHQFEVKDAEKHGVSKAILLHHLKFHMDSNQKDERYIYDDKVWAFAKLESLEKMYPYFTKSSISRWLRELEKDEVIASRKPKKNQGKHLKHYTVLAYSPSNSQNGKSISQNRKSGNSQNGKSTIVNNIKSNKGNACEVSGDQENSPGIVNRVRDTSTINELYDIYKEYREQKGYFPTLFEEDATKHMLREWGLKKSKLIMIEAIRNGWISLKKDYLADNPESEFESEGLANASAYTEYQG